MIARHGNDIESIQFEAKALGEPALQNCSQLKFEIDLQDIIEVRSF